MLKQLAARKSVAAIAREIESGPRLKRVLGARTLTSIGLGSMIGSGIFVLTGTVAANHTGPAITLAFLVAAIGCGLAAICYAELAALIPVSGSAYSYTYATLGEAVAWFVGWNLALEYMMSAATVAVGWSGYVVNLLEEFGVHLPAALTSAPVDKGTDHTPRRHRRARQPARGADRRRADLGVLPRHPRVRVDEQRHGGDQGGDHRAVHRGGHLVRRHLELASVPAAEHRRVRPFRLVSGVMMGAAIIYFAYIGFDTAATTAQEARDPQRDVPAGILGALVISTVLYVAMAAVMTGMVSYTKLDVAAPVAVALDAHPSLFWLGLPVKIGAIIGMTSVILMSILGQPRIFMAMSRDGLLPPQLQKVHPKYQTPHVGTLITGVIAAFFAGVFPIDVLGELVSIGILLAFTAVCAGVLVLRYTMPEAPRPFRVPFAPLICTAGVLMCLGLTFFLPHDTWMRLAVWTAVGFAIYFGYGYRNSKRTCGAEDERCD